MAMDFQSIYAGRAADYERLVAREDHQRNLPRVLAGIGGMRAGLDIVELGAGTGRVTRLLAPHARRLIALDQSAHMLGLAAALGGLDPCVLFAAADTLHVPLPATCADLVVEGWSFGHFNFWDSARWREAAELSLTAMQRVLRPGGLAVLIETLGTGSSEPQPPTPALGAFYRYLVDERGFEQTWVRTDYAFESLEEAVELVGFFFGQDLAQRVQREQLRIRPECTGSWWRRV